MMPSKPGLRASHHMVRSTKIPFTRPECVENHASNAALPASLSALGQRTPAEFGQEARGLSFSYGPHHCIGAAAACLQARIAIEGLLTRCPDFSVDAEKGRYSSGHFVRRYESLPFRARGPG